MDVTRSFKFFRTIPMTIFLGERYICKIFLFNRVYTINYELFYNCSNSRPDYNDESDDHARCTPCEKCPYLQGFFITKYSVLTWENMDQKNSKYYHFFTHW